MSTLESVKVYSHWGALRSSMLVSGLIHIWLWVLTLQMELRFFLTPPPRTAGSSYNKRKYVTLRESLPYQILCLTVGIAKSVTLCQIVLSKLYFVSILSIWECIPQMITKCLVKSIFEYHLATNVALGRVLRWRNVNRKLKVKVFKTVLTHCNIRKWGRDVDSQERQLI